VSEVGLAITVPLLSVLSTDWFLEGVKTRFLSISEEEEISQALRLWSISFMLTRVPLT
jgi:hypothetical protein